jgi:transposase
MTADLLEALDWLTAERVEAAAMESTGVLWKPIWNIMSESLKLILVNARHIKNVPGRKTDIKDSEWIAQLLQHGLLQASYVPHRPQRELRDLTRHRSQLIAEQTRMINRIHKTLEDTNIKLGSVASDIMGKSGRLMILALISGQDDPEELANLAHGRMRSKMPELRRAMKGRLTDHHRFMLKHLMDHVKQLQAMIVEFDERIGELLGPFDSTVQRVMAIPGLGRRTAENILAEIGTDMSRFPTSGHLTSWASICPGNYASAGKQKSGRTTHGNRWLKQALTQAAWASARTRNSYFSAQYRRLAGRRGKKRAIVAIAHSLLVVVYHMLRDNTEYQDLGHDYFEKLRPNQLTRYFYAPTSSPGIWSNGSNL